MVKQQVFDSWGGVTSTPKHVVRPDHTTSGTAAGSCLPYGAGRSYGDTCLPAGDTILHTTRLDRIISFDRDKGILRAGSGMSLRNIVEVILPQGWFLPVTPGTAEVTLGGALANDVHGKNHHVAGTFGLFVRAFELVRSDRAPIVCSREENSDYFAATIGGMGLTGLVTWVEIDLIAVGSANMRQTITHFADVESYFALDASRQSATYSVAWIDGLAPRKALGRGLLIEGEHADDGDCSVSRRASINIPFIAPVGLVWRVPVMLMNAFYLRQPGGQRVVDIDKFFYPLDRIGHWSRLYGPRGFHQFQCVIPENAACATVRKLLEIAHEDAGGSSLVVLKKFGDIPSPGMLSFPMPGYTLTMDFPHKGDTTTALIEKLDAVALKAGGRINPYKARAMGAETFYASFPQWRNILPFLDPCAESRFSRRVGLDREKSKAANAGVAISHSP